jgi:hypothetical protein
VHWGVKGQMEAIENEIQDHIFDNTIWEKAVSIRLSDQIWSRCQVQDEKRKLKDPLREIHIPNNVKRMDLKRQMKRQENLLEFGAA